LGIGLWRFLREGLCDEWGGNDEGWEEDGFEGEVKGGGGGGRGGLLVGGMVCLGLMTRRRRRRRGGGEEECIAAAEDLE
jgi:hypothetical protein